MKLTLKWNLWRRHKSQHTSDCLDLTKFDMRYDKETADTMLNTIEHVAMLSGYQFL